MSKSVSYQPSVSIRPHTEADNLNQILNLLCVNLDSAIISTYQTVIMMICKYLFQLKKSYQVKHMVTVKNANDVKLCQKQSPFSFPQVLDCTLYYII